MNLSARLTAIYNMIYDGAVVADIGTDHGLLPCALVLNNKSPKVFASDNKAGPLNKARTNIAITGLQDRIELVLADGLAPAFLEADVVVLAGLGVETISHILTPWLSQLSAFDYLLIQANRKPYRLRQWLSENSLSIAEEELVYDEHFYQILKVLPKAHPPYTKEDIFLGPCLKKRKDALWYAYIREDLERLLKVRQVRQSENRDWRIAVYEKLIRDRQL
ncbi:MAG: class I SAM-dependent methyltransferase [Erysipelotrichaceae bacterium]|jgi:tRNA (adenine22-N1)-methyltransferase|nr:class I SAM-dependent methyltransferase [Erysipelotrichaceae bacterium]